MKGAALFFMAFVWLAPALLQAQQSQISCFAGGCLSEGWQSTGVRPQDNYTVQCHNYDCAYQGWSTYYAQGGMEQSLCLGRACFIDGWQSYNQWGQLLSSAQCYSAQPYYYPPYGYPPYGYPPSPYPYDNGWGGGLGGGTVWPCLSGGWTIRYHSGPRWMGPWWGPWGNWWNQVQQISMRCVQNNCAAWGWNFRNPATWGGHGRVRCQHGGCFNNGWLVY